MKKIISILVLGLLLSGNGYAECTQGDCRNGKATFTFPNGRIYVGEFKDGIENGQGTLTYTSGNKYVGEFKDGKSHGQGTFTFPNGNKYVGEFKDGKSHGEGILKFPDGRIEKGLWEKGKLVKKETTLYDQLYNKCIVENLKGYSDQEAIKIIKDDCRGKASKLSKSSKKSN
jgi:hypothetical protein